jgi:hypothetical protein
LQCVSAFAPASQYAPFPQSPHVNWPASAWYLPATHLSHAAVLLFGATVPGAHLSASALRPGHLVPAGQAAQRSADVSPWLPLYVPAGQGWLRALVDPVSQ